MAYIDINPFDGVQAHEDLRESDFVKWELDVPASRASFLFEADPYTSFNSGELVQLDSDNDAVVKLTTPADCVGMILKYNEAKEDEVIIISNSAEIYYEKLDYNGQNEDAVNAALLARGIRVITGGTVQDVASL
jgi:predicted nucleotidyltransferase